MMNSRRSHARRFAILVGVLVVLGASPTEALRDVMLELLVAALAGLVATPP